MRPPPPRRAQPHLRAMRLGECPMASAHLKSGLSIHNQLQNWSSTKGFNHNVIVYWCPVMYANGILLFTGAICTFSHTVSTNHSKSRWCVDQSQQEPIRCRPITARAGGCGGAAPPEVGDALPPALAVLPHVPALRSVGVPYIPHVIRSL